MLLPPFEAEYPVLDEPVLLEGDGTGSPLHPRHPREVDATGPAFAAALTTGHGEAATAIGYVRDAFEQWRGWITRGALAGTWVGDQPQQRGSRPGVPLPGRT